MQKGASVNRLKQSIKGSHLLKDDLE